ncbi:radical SAM protein, partial [Candidatus Woesearchaeota archaeon]|nr:radical SAM protein [Candidatus Woesearchaeota archaeon]
PWEWLYLPEEKQISLLRGYMLGDGYKISKRIGFNTTSKILAEQLQIILNRLGIWSSLQITKKGKYESNINGRKFKSKSDRYDVWVFSEAKERLNSMIGNMFKLDEKKVHKPARWKITSKYIFTPITHVTKKMYRGHVYNFSVKDSHSYTVHGVAVSNCNIPMKRSYRPRSIKSAVDEFEYIQENMPFLNEVMLEDDTFPMFKDRTLKFCDELISKGIKLTWSCNARVNTDKETLEKMKEAGCRLTCVGFETPTQTSLNSIIKGQTKDMQVEFRKRADETGMLVNGCFILGLPHDTPETMKATINFAKYINPNTAQFYPMMVYPGTGAYQWAKSSGFLETEDFSNWLTPEGWHRTTVSRPDLKSEEVLRWCNKARLEFYTNPAYIRKMIRQAATNPKEAVRIAKASNVLFRHMARYMFTGSAKTRSESAAGQKQESVQEQEEKIPVLN